MGNSHSTPSAISAADTLASRVLCDAHSTTAIIKGGDVAKSIASSRISRGDLHRLCVEFANILRNNGVRPGDVVTVVDSNTLDFVVAFLGVTYARAVAAPLNQNYTTEEFKYYMKDAKSKMLVTGANGNKAAEEAGVVPGMSITVKVDGQSASLHVTGSKKLKESKLKDFFVSDPPRGDDVALFLHTSGTTSRPKGVPLSHANLVASLENIKGTYEFSSDDVSLLVMPLFHVHGLMAGLLSPLLSGASVVLPEAGKFSAGTFWKDAVDHKVTFYTAVPTMHQILVSRAEKDYPKDNPPPLRVIRSCSSSLAPATLFQVEKLFKAPVLEAYAMTEASHQMTSNPLPKHGERKPGTVGKPQGSVKVAILDDSCNVLGPDKVGEVCIQGPNVTRGYKNNPVANKEAFAGGWFHTGDQGYLSEDGYLSLTGRIKELINRGGEKISPLEVCFIHLSTMECARVQSDRMCAVGNVFFSSMTN
jgi:acyl-CoA synthetase (AMP-forming)/AMP-acid ligase II